MFKFVLFSFVTLSVAVSAPAFADISDYVPCNESGYMCYDDELYEVFVRCEGPDPLFGGDVIFYENSNSMWIFDVWFTYDGGPVCAQGGIFLSPRTEVKCSSAEKGSGMPDKEHYESDAVTVEVEMDWVPDDFDECPAP